MGRVGVEATKDSPGWWPQAPSASEVVIRSSYSWGIDVFVGGKHWGGRGGANRICTVVT